LTATGAHILVVDDEPAIVTALRRILKARGFAVEIAETGGEALQSYAKKRPDVLILDLGLPDMEGTAVIREIRSVGDTPIIVLSVRESEREKVQALDLGADDYLTKPFGIDELLARVRVALRRTAHPRSGAEAVYRSGGLEVDLERRRVRAQGRDVHLTPTEFELLRAFIQHPDKLMTDRVLLQQVWGPDYGLQTHYLHVYISRLRAKIEEDPERPRHLLTEPGVGYRLVTEAE
jgi:two-component system, OmpR family, KDP operon response regulator KdpE